METFQIIYLWRNERHRVLTTFTDRHEADLALSEIRSKGWKAWIEII